jgi:hypothetical protein
MDFSFQTSRDVNKPLSYVVTAKELRVNKATLTLSTTPQIVAGESIEVSGVDASFDGLYVATEVTSTTVSYDLFLNDIPASAATGLLIAPPRAYLKFSQADAFLDDLINGSSTNFNAEPWDYNTVRLLWSSISALDAKARTDIGYGLVPRMAITRSAFGAPRTPLDGEKILDIPYAVGIGNVDGRPAAYFESQPGDPENDWNRPPAASQGLYDRNLQPGRWYYYSLFFYLRGDALEQRWILSDTAYALLPFNYRHGEKFFDLLPPYYQYEDDKFAPGTGREGVLRRTLKTVGFEADYSRTLAEGIQDIYNVDFAPYPLLEALGETNFGIPQESGIGNTRYRSLIYATNNLYDERGSISALQKLAVASTKYSAKVLRGNNMMNLADDAEFLAGTGSWGDLTVDFSAFVAANWAGTFNTPKMTLVTDAGGPSLAHTRRGAVRLERAAGDVGDKLLIACGLGQGLVANRLHTEEATDFYPRFHGIRCLPGVVYTFSFYARRLGGSAGSITSGVMWFSLPANYGEFDITDDFISLYEESDLTANDSTSGTMTRNKVSALAPISLRGEPYVYAVPYIITSNSEQRHITAVMFNRALNSASTFVVTQDQYLTLGDVTELIGDTNIVIGDG